MLRYIFLLFCTVVTFTIVGLLTNFLQAVLYVSLKYINRRVYHKINGKLFHTYAALYMFFVDWYSNSEIHLYMNQNDYDRYFGKENMFIISNHPTEIDWMILGTFTAKANFLSVTKFFIKDFIKYIPGVGMNMYLADNIMLSRNYKKDKTRIEKVMREYEHYPSDIAIILTPEGTRFTKEKHDLSMKYAQENNLPVLKYHLTPRTKGFTVSLPLIRKKLNAVYCVTWAYEPEVPKMSDLLFGRQVKAFCYVKRIPIGQIPEDEAGISTFLYNLFAEKDKLLDNYYKTGDFRTEVGKQTVERIKLSKKNSLLWNAVIWYTVCVGIVLSVSLYLLIYGPASVFITCLSIYLIMLFAGLKIETYATMKTASSYGLNYNNNNNCSKVK